MTATVVERLTDFAGRLPSHGTLGMAANIVLLKGTIVTKDGDGRADVPTNGQDAMGVAEATFLNRTTDPSGGDADAVNAELKFGVFGFLFTGATPEPCDVLYVVDNQTVSVDSDTGARGIAGYCTEVRNGKAYLWIGPHVAAGIQISALVSAVADEALENADQALAEIQDLILVDVPVPLGGFASAAGLPVPAFANGTVNGFNLADSEAFGIRFNPSGDLALAAMWTCVQLPADMDPGETVTLHFMVSRIGALDTTVTITPTVFANREGVAYDAGSSLVSGNTAPAIGGATKVVTETTLEIVGAEPNDVLSISMIPSSALDTDDLLIHSVKISCTRLVAE